MKNFLSIVIVSALAFSVVGCAASRQATTSATDSVTAAQVEKMLSERLFKVDVDRAYPLTAPSFALTYPYFISVIGDRVESFLPYFGRAYTAPYGGGEGLRFEGSVSGYSETKKKNGRREIVFRATTREDTYHFSLTVFPLGESNLVITPSQKQTISFSGRLDLAPDFEAVRVP